MEKWFGKTAVITGAANGIGKGIAKDFVSLGMVVISLDIEDCDVDKVTNIKCDVRDINQVKHAFKIIEDNHGGVDILINNAGVCFSGLVLDIPSEDLKETIDTNFTGIVLCTKEALINMKKKDTLCCIIMINSISGHSYPCFDKPILNVYSGTKFAMTSFSEHLRREIRFLGLKIKVTNLSPSIVDTAITRTQINEFLENNPHLKIEDVCDAVRYVLGTSPEVHVKELILHAFNDPL